MNPWIRREHRERLAKQGAPYSHPDYPEWRFHVRPADRFNSDWATEAARLGKRKDFAALQERERADGYKQTPADRKLAERFHLELFCAAGLGEWAGVTDREDREIPYTPANALSIFEAFPEIAAGAMAFSANSDNFAPLEPGDKAAAVEGNS